MQFNYDLSISYFSEKSFEINFSTECFFMTIQAMHVTLSAVTDNLKTYSMKLKGLNDEKEALIRKYEREVQHAGSPEGFFHRARLDRIDESIKVNLCIIFAIFTFSFFFYKILRT